MDISPKAKGTLAVLIAMTAFVLIWQRYYDFLNKGRRPPESTQILNEMEKTGLPEFKLKDLKGVETSLSQFKGKIVVINFWASWCAPCVSEFPSLMKLIAKYKGEIVLLAVSADYEEKDIETFLKAFKVNDPNVHVMWDKDQEVAKKYGTFKLPESYIVARDGKLIRKVTGVDDWSTTEAFEYFADVIAGKEK
jgi:cytochrome c biogenesis protein CcmG/thiol:disulfide interchange protein DsbE